MNSRFKIGFIRVLSYGPSADEQEKILLDYGVLAPNIFRAKPDTVLDAVKACRKGNQDILAIAFSRVMGKYTGDVLKELDHAGADLYIASTDRLYSGANGETFHDLLKDMRKGQTAKARATEGYKKGGAKIKLTKDDLLEAEQLILQGNSMAQVGKMFKVAPNYFNRRGITVESVRAKYDN